MTRDKVTKEFYPDKVTCEEFIKDLTHPAELKAFIKNMEDIQRKNDGSLPYKMYPEEWLSIFQAWKELHYETK